MVRVEMGLEGGRSLKQRQKDSLAQLREHQVRKAKAQKNGTAPPKIGISKDEKSVSPHSSVTSNGDNPVPLTKKSVYSLKPAKRIREKIEIEDGEIRVEKRQRTAYSDRAIAPMSAAPPAPTKQSCGVESIQPAGDHTSEPLSQKSTNPSNLGKRNIDQFGDGEVRNGKKRRTCSSEMGAKPQSTTPLALSKPSYKGTAKSRATQESCPYKGTAKDVKDPAQSAVATARQSTRTETVRGTESAKQMESLKPPGLAKSRKAKTEEAPAKVSGAEMVNSKNISAQHDDILHASPLIPPVKPEAGSLRALYASARKHQVRTQQKTRGKTASTAEPSVPISPLSKREKLSDEKASARKSEDAKSSDETISVQYALKDGPRDVDESGKQDSDRESDSKSSGKKREAENDAAGDAKRPKFEGRYVKPEPPVTGDHVKKPDYTKSFRKPMPPAVGSKPTGTPLVSGVPIGLHNFGLTCFSNAVVQCLDTIPEFVDFYRAQAKDTLKMEEDCILTEDQKIHLSRRNTKGMLAEKLKARIWFKKAKDAIRIKAYLGELFERMHTAGSADSFVSPFEFMQAAGVLLKDGDGRSVNGEREMDAEEFYGLLLRQLEDEEVNGRSSHTNPPSPTVVETLLGSSTADLVSCSSCGYSQLSGKETTLSVNIGVPRIDTTTSLEGCLDAFAKSTDRAETKCRVCRNLGGITASRRIQRLAKYAVINVARFDTNGKIGTHIPLPTGELDLAPYFASLDNGEDHRYEVIAVAEHRGRSIGTGHWQACKKVDGKWWFCNDHEVSRLRSEQDMSRHELGSLFFLKKVE